MLCCVERKTKLQWERFPMPGLELRPSHPSVALYDRRKLRLAADRLNTSRPPPCLSMIFSENRCTFFRIML
jgi:hypothetical protein